MANKNHLKILARGVGEWNRWRVEHREIRPDLISADLRGTNLAGCNFGGANLGAADLSSAKLIAVDFGKADLYYANLSGSDLRGSALVETSLVNANLKNANLNGVALTRADLTGALLQDTDLTSARLSGANLTGASLRGANVSKAGMRGTTFDNIDLREVKGLEHVMHGGPSEISISTLYRSEGRIPEVFLRGCGVPEEFIIQMPALVSAMQPIQFHSCFISYSRKDQKFAERLHADLQNRGVRCWYAPKDLRIGARIRVGIDESIRVHDKLLLILSRHSIESAWVEKEVETAMEREQGSSRAILFPIRLDDTVLNVENGWAADVRRSRNVGDFRRWKDHDTYRKAFERLIRDLKAEG